MPGRPPVTVVGMVGGEVFGHRAVEAMAGADVLVGARRHLTFVSAGPSQEVVELAAPLHPLVDRLAAARDAGRSVTVVASGDPGFFGIVRLLGERLGSESLAVLPAPSSVALAFGRAGLSWEDAVVVSAHGRPPEAAVEAVLGGRTVAVLTSPQTPPSELARLALAAGGDGDRPVVVASRLGEADESVTRTDVAGLAGGSFDALSVVIVVASGLAAPAGEGLGGGWGLDDDQFERRAGLITKSEVRAVVLAKLSVPRSGVLWDVGAGSGSVGIECARISPRLRVIAIERNGEDAERIRRNAKAHGVSVEVVVGEAPDALVGLPAPNRVFVGGGGLDSLRASWDAVVPGGTLVATHVLVDRVTEAFGLLGNTVQISAARGVSLSDGFRLDAQNPVFVSWGTKV